MEALIARTPQTFRDKQQIDARILHEVEEIDLTVGGCACGSLIAVVSAGSLLTSC